MASSWAAVSDLSAARGEGTAQLTAATDRQTLLTQDTPLSVAYRFRALSLAEAAYPYLAGGSNVVVVRKR